MKTDKDNICLESKLNTHYSHSKTINSNQHLSNLKPPDISFKNMLNIFSSSLLTSTHKSKTKNTVSYFQSIISYLQHIQPNFKNQISLKNTLQYSELIENLILLSLLNFNFDFDTTSSINQKWENNKDSKFQTQITQIFSLLNGILLLDTLSKYFSTFSISSSLKSKLQKICDLINNNENVYTYNSNLNTENEVLDVNKTDEEDEKFKILKFKFEEPENSNNISHKEKLHKISFNFKNIGKQFFLYCLQLLQYWFFNEEKEELNKKNSKMIDLYFDFIKCDCLNEEKTFINSSSTLIFKSQNFNSRIYLDQIIQMLVSFPDRLISKLKGFLNVSNFDSIKLTYRDTIPFNFQPENYFKILLKQFKHIFLFSTKLNQSCKLDCSNSQKGFAQFLNKLVRLKRQKEVACFLQEAYIDKDSETQEKNKIIQRLLLNSSSFYFDIYTFTSLFSEFLNLELQYFVQNTLKNFENQPTNILLSSPFVETLFFDTFIQKINDFKFDLNRIPIQILFSERLWLSPFPLQLLSKNLDKNFEIELRLKLDILIDFLQYFSDKIKPFLKSGDEKNTLLEYVLDKLIQEQSLKKRSLQAYSILVQTHKNIKLNCQHQYEFDQLTHSIVRLIQKLSLYRENDEENSSRISSLIDKNLSQLLSGVQMRLESSIESVRHCGMLVAETFSNISLKQSCKKDSVENEQMLKFDELCDSQVEKQSFQVSAKEIFEFYNNKFQTSSSNSNLKVTKTNFNFKNNSKIDNSHNISSSSSSEDDFEYFYIDKVDKRENRRRAPKPKTLIDLWNCLRDTQSVEHIDIGMRYINKMIELPRFKAVLKIDESLVLCLSRTLLILNNEYGLDNFASIRIEALTKLCCISPLDVGALFVRFFYEPNHILKERVDVLEIFCSVARRLSNINSANTDRKSELSSDEYKTRKNFYNLRPINEAKFKQEDRWNVIDKRVEEKTKRLIKKQNNSVNTKKHYENYFAINLICPYFYGLLNRLDLRNDCEGSNKNKFNKNFKSNNNIFCLIGTDYMLLSKFVFTLGFFVECAGSNSSSILQVCQSLLHLLKAIRMHEDACVRRAVAYSLSRMILVTQKSITLFSEFQFHNEHNTSYSYVTEIYTPNDLDGEFSDAKYNGRLQDQLFQLKQRVTLDEDLETSKSARFCLLLFQKIFDSMILPTLN